MMNAWIIVVAVVALYPSFKLIGILKEAGRLVPSHCQGSETAR